MRNWDHDQLELVLFTSSGWNHSKGRSKTLYNAIWPKPSRCVSMKMRARSSDLVSTIQNETVILNVQNKMISQVCYDNRFLNEFVLRRLVRMALSAAKSALQILEALLLTREIEMFVRIAW